MDPVLLYITAANREEAISLSQELLRVRLIACANITEHATSLYHWQGALEQQKEAVIVAKTLRGKVEALTEAVRKLHSYSNPCVLALPIVGGNAEYIAWLAGEVSGDA